MFLLCENVLITLFDKQTCDRLDRVHCHVQGRETCTQESYSRDKHKPAVCHPRTGFTHYMTVPLFHSRSGILVPFYGSVESQIRPDSEDLGCPAWPVSRRENNNNETPQVKSMK